MNFLYIPKLLWLLFKRRIIHPRTMNKISRLELENLSLRQQLIAQAKTKKEPTLNNNFRIFWKFYSKIFDFWREVLCLVKPATVIGWFNNSFKKYWTRIIRNGKRKKRGRPPVSLEIRKLIRQMAHENPTWGYPKIHGELLMLGFEIEQSTVKKYMPRRNPDPKKRQSWKVFLKNHLPEIVAMDFFTVSILSFSGFKMLYVFFIISHDRRKILHYNATFAPTADWTCQQIKAAFPKKGKYRYMICDNDKIFSKKVVKELKDVGIKTKKTSFRSPWQNGVAERFIGSIRRECMDHMIPLSQKHVLRLIKNYVDYYHETRTHLSLKKDAPVSRAIQRRPSPDAKIISIPQANGLHHRYEWHVVAS